MPRVSKTQTIGEVMDNIKKENEAIVKAHEIIKPMNIYQRMAAITVELRTVAKNLSVDTGKGSGYKAVSERDVLDAVKPVEVKYGIYSYPADRKILESQILETETKYGTRTSFFTRVETTYRFVNIDYPNEMIETKVFSEGIDSQDKGSGKSMSYADKYALLKMYKISTGEDPDQTASEDVDYKPIATTDEKAKFIEAAKQMGLDATEVLKKIGWKGGNATKEQIGLALKEIKKVSDEKHS